MAQPTPAACNPGTMPGPGDDPDCFIVEPGPQYKMWKAAQDAWNLLSQLPSTHGAADGVLTSVDDDTLPPEITGEGIVDCPILQGPIPPNQGVRFVGLAGQLLPGTFHMDTAADWLKTMGNLPYHDSRVKFIKIPGTANEVRCYEHPLTRQLCCAAVHDEVYAAKFKPTI